MDGERNPGLDGLWSGLRSSAHRCLMLDFDGTLAPIQIDRQAARMDPLVAQSLRILLEQGITRVAVISGRPLDELMRLARLGTGGKGEPLQVSEFFGEHGWDRWLRGRRWRHPIPEPARRALARAEALAQSAGCRILLEPKRCSLAVHTRALSEERAEEMEKALADLWSAPEVASQLRIVGIAGGIELRVPGRDKGTAVTEILAEEPAGTCAAYVGDDQTDEDAFRAIRGQGLGVRVGGLPLASAAGGGLASIAEVPGFLRRWAAEESALIHRRAGTRRR